MSKIEKLALKALPFWDKETGFSSIHEDWCEINNLKPLAKAKVPGAKEVKNLSYAILSNTDRNFWANLEPLSGINFLHYLLSNFHGQISILTSPIQKSGRFSEECMWGKADWIRKYVDPEIMIIFDNEKENYATASSLLIDDRYDKLAKFKEAGGMTLDIKHINTHFFYATALGCSGWESFMKEKVFDNVNHIYWDMDGCLTNLQKSLKSLITETMNSLL